MKKIKDSKIKYDIIKLEDVYNSLKHVKLDAYRMLHKPEVKEEYIYYKKELNKISISSSTKQIQKLKLKIERICDEIDYLLSVY